ncbi:MAG TPA: hypothetical protein VK191_11055 [Symbiobacteriaceae bacterium]|nr:hypothetical protein [Symbiobacteriaceae bacterium]
MRERHLPPMAGGSDHDVICIETKKICDFCFQEDRIERQFNWQNDWDDDRDGSGGRDGGSGGYGDGGSGGGGGSSNRNSSGNRDGRDDCTWRNWCEKAEVHCQIDRDNICCTEVDRKEIDCEKCLSKVTVRVEVPLIIWVDGKCQRKTIIFLKQAILSAPHGTCVECDVSGHCSCVLDWESKCLICVVDLCVVIKSFTTVQVLVPTLGFCTPKKCHGLQACPPMPNKCCDKVDRRHKDCSGCERKDCECCH